MPGAKWSPEQHRRRARATAGFGLRRSDGYSVQMERRGGGFGSVAHGESDEQVGELGDAETAANRRARPSATEGEEDEAAGDAGRPSARGQGGAKQRTMAELADEVGS